MGRKGFEITRYDKRRKHKRFKATKPISIKFKTHNMTNYKDGYILDISQSGIRFTINNKSNLLDIIYLYDKIIIQIASQIYLAKVRHISKNFCGCELIKKIKTISYKLL